MNAYVITHLIGNKESLIFKVIYANDLFEIIETLDFGEDLRNEDIEELNDQLLFYSKVQINNYIIRRIK